MARVNSPWPATLAGYASSRVSPVSSGPVRPAGSRKPGLTCSMPKSVTRPPSSLIGRTTSTDSARPSSSS